MKAGLSGSFLDLNAGRRPKDKEAAGKLASAILFISEEGLVQTKKKTNKEKREKEEESAVVKSVWFLHGGKRVPPRGWSELCF